MMDFLSLMIIYAVCFFSSALVVFGGSKNSNIAIIRWLFVYGDKVSSFLWHSFVPGVVRSKLDNLTNRLLYQRNAVFQVIYFLLWLMVFVHFSFEVNPLLKKYRMSPGVVLLAYAGFFINFILFLCCSWTNPGIITKANYRKCINIYEYDGEMFKKGIRCESCDVIKPARSKHCAICDHCVNRFDHHCTWVNNCVGARNVGYFVLFLLSLTVQCAFLAALSTVAMFNVAKYTGLLDAQYVDANNVRRPVDVFIIVQHLFLQRPFVIFIASSLWLLVVLTGGFAAYHLFLAITNQTTNERYKLAALKRSVRSRVPENSGDSDRTSQLAWTYSNGPLKNLKEVLLGIR